jgi:selenocysteine lyase/cysteine desulfurase
VAEEHREGEPLEENWISRAGSEEFARLIDYRDEYQPGARRFDVGGRTNFELTPMTLAALAQIQAWGVSNVSAALGRITAEIGARVSELGLEPLPPDERGPHMLGVTLPEGTRERVLAALSEGGCFAALRGTSLRIAPHLHVTDADVDRLTGALSKAVGNERA